MSASASRSGRCRAQEIAARVAEALGLVRLEGFGDRGDRRAVRRAAAARGARPRADHAPQGAAPRRAAGRARSQAAPRHAGGAAPHPAEIGGTFIFVTHDQTEAFALATRIVVMNEGRVEQVGAPQTIYLDPHSLFVADFVGETTCWPARGRRRGDARAGVDFRARRRRRGARRHPAGSVRSGPADHGDRPVTDVVFLGDALKVVARCPPARPCRARSGRAPRADYRSARPAVRLGAGDQRVIEGRRDECGATRVPRAGARHRRRHALPRRCCLLFVISFWSVRSFGCSRISLSPPGRASSWTMAGSRSTRS